MSKKQRADANLPPVSKQTAGGITGAVLGGIVAGPVGAVAGGVAGALVGNSSAKGNQPIKTAANTIRSKFHVSQAPQATPGKAKHAKLAAAPKKPKTPTQAVSKPKVKRTPKRTKRNA